MPELPEVETIRVSLDPVLVGRTIADVELRAPMLRRPLDQTLRTALLGRRIVGSSRRGKYLLLALSDGRTWFFHMGMSGRLRFVDGEHLPALHEHLLARFVEGGTLVFHDPRRFGLSVVEDAAVSKLLADMGPEPLDEQRFTAQYLCSRRATTRRSIKDVLMDQRVVAGLGNIYVNEILFRAGLRPRRSIKRLTAADLERVVEATRTVIADAIEHRGSTISDFLDGIGRRGGYQWRHCVYDREGQPCPSCRTPIKAVIVGQRSSFYCPKCQR
ncbi:MAG TPA: bifunctional DNA-formamidopyrimidine glycosylase/DNA-(apurinic or apyrimidinic site) lyase [Candidatus Limnocylindrales bacterium]|nr:bifunctional DNA-formamidopyrimidine glycosylase/DNA-(apurinic or apyrimidinic site) lyase [Candidatus Limnocylindrales bacterium]